MGHLYFVRHGETVWNVENKICGATDIALTDRGHEQAIATGEELVRQGVHIDKILYSPLIRAAETARHISGDYRRAAAGRTAPDRTVLWQVGIDTARRCGFSRSQKAICRAA